METRSIFILVYIVIMAILVFIHYINKDADSDDPIVSISITFIILGYFVITFFFILSTSLTEIETTYEKLDKRQVEILKNDSRAIIIYNRPDNFNVERTITSHKKYLNVNDTSDFYLRKDYNFWGFAVDKSLRLPFEVESEKSVK